MVNLNPHVSVDCVIFGFHDSKLKVLLIEREKVGNSPMKGHKLKLPGSLITESEDLDISAIRIQFSRKVISSGGPCLVA
jgi:8-oxo-dGTP diphosphatase